MSRPHFSRNSRPKRHRIRTNERIRAREVRVVDADGKQLGIVSKQDAINLARSRGVDLVEVAENASPPVCRLVDYGKYCYELSKKQKESKKHQHSNRVKEVQLSVKIDPHDAAVKRDHAIEFLCEELKVKVSLRFRGREMAHQEVGREVMMSFIEELAPYGHPDATPKKTGRTLNCMISPLPKNKRAPNPRQVGNGEQPESSSSESSPQPEKKDDRVSTEGGSNPDGFGSNVLSLLDSDAVRTQPDSGSSVRSTD